MSNEFRSGQLSTIAGERDAAKRAFGDGGGAPVERKQPDVSDRPAPYSSAPPNGRQHIERVHPGGWPRLYPYEGFRARLTEAWWVLTSRYTLHRAWQRGYDQHAMDESARRAHGGQ